MTIFLDGRIILAALACFMYGSIPFPLIATYLVSGIRIDRAGTRNIGIANAFGSGGLAAGFMTVVAVASQSVLPLLLNMFWIKAGIEVSLVLLSVTIIGAQVSLFTPRKSVNGGTLLLWGLLFLSPLSLGLFGAVFGLLFLSSRNNRLTTIFGYLLLPAEIWLVERSLPFVFFGFVAAALYAFRYDPARSEFRLFRGKRWLNWPPKKRLIIPINAAARSGLYGNKASSLHRLQRSGARIPDACVCSSRAYLRWLARDDSVEKQLADELMALIQTGRSYAVRSSSSSEDGPDFSFAGQFDSYLNLQSVSEISAAIRGIWESATSDRVTSYLEKTEKSGEGMVMAVIVQEMVDSRLAGAVFTRNPVTGLNETIVEAVSGSGEALMQQGVTPMRWIFKWGTLLESSHEAQEHLGIAEQVASEARRLDIKMGGPLDLEWAWDGQHVYWLQARNITSIKGVNIYSNRISREFMPGMIKPLVWSINTSVVNNAWKNLFREVIGRQAERIDIKQLAKPFYYRSYFNMGVIGDIFELLGMPRESLELLLGIDVIGGQRPRFRPGIKILRFLPSMLVFAAAKMFYIQRLEKLLPKLLLQYRDMAGIGIASMPNELILEHWERLVVLNTTGSYYVIVSRLIASIQGMLARRLVPGADVEKHQDENLLPLSRKIDPAFQFNLLKESFQALPPEQARKFALVKANTVPEGENGVPFYEDFSRYMSDFGHLSDSGNDFSRVQWQENHRIVMDMLINDTSNTRRSGSQTQAADRDKDLRCSWFQRSALRRAAKAQYIRALSNYTYEFGYSLFRHLFLELGGRLVNMKRLEASEDIFFLYDDELKGSLDADTDGFDALFTVASRRREMDLFRDISLPQTIVGDELPLPLASSQVKECIKGVPVSRGYCEGVLRVVHGVTDFNRVERGDVVAIPYSDISWTPVLGKAGAIISESGGLLSHCSIVAREYGIPAVVSVEQAMKLPDGKRVTVDGGSGEICLL